MITHTSESQSVRELHSELLACLRKLQPGSDPSKLVRLRKTRDSWLLSLSLRGPHADAIQIHCDAEALSVARASRRYRFSLAALKPSLHWRGARLWLEVPRRAQPSTRFERLQSELWELREDKKTVFATRALGAVREILRAAPKDALDEASCAPNDLLALCSGLEAGLTGEAVRADPLVRARLRGVKARWNLLSSEGEPLTSEEVAALLGISRQAVNKRRSSGKLLAIRLGARFGYPSWQFEKRQTVTGLEETLDALAQHDPWMQLAFFVNGNTRLAGETPLSELRLGHREQVVEAAQSYGEHGAA